MGKLRLEGIVYSKTHKIVIEKGLNLGLLFHCIIYILATQTMICDSSSISNLLKI